MKKTLLVAILVFTMFFTAYQSREITEPVSTQSVPQIFFVDRRLHRLISLDFPQSGTAENICRKMVKSLISGRDDNKEILRIIPDKPGIISVEVKKDAAYVDLSESIINMVEKNSENERLIIYQIVNSLASVDGINKVLFTIDGKVEKNFMGFLDMREIFTPNYDI